MNIPQIYLVEPYNAYAPKGKKKHWHEIVEEQALMERIIAEQMALQEAQSRTLPADAPNTSISTATVVGSSAGAGGQPVYAYFHPELDAARVNFNRTPATGDGPLTVTFTNFTPTPEFDTYLWVFGDGTTSTEVNPVKVYQSGSNSTNVWTASLQASSSGDVPIGVSPNVYISASKPTVTAAFTFVTSSNSVPSIATFTNTSVNSSQTPTTTYLWLYGTGSLTSTSVTPSPVSYLNAGPYTASLQMTGSYGLTSFTTRSWRIA